MSLAERIQNLRISEDRWKQRVEQPPVVVNRSSSTVEKKIGSISSLKSQLSTSQEGWKARVGPKDNEAVTVKGKLQRDHRVPVAAVAVSKPTTPEESVPEEPQKEEIEKTPSPPTSLDLPDDRSEEDSSSISSPSVSLESSEMGSGDGSTTHHPLPLLPREKLLKPLARAGPKRNRGKGRKYVQNENDPSIPDIHQGVKLKCPTPAPILPTTLYRIKGRRKPIPVLVDTAWSNVTRGDCYVLFSQDCVYCFYGEYSNLLEKLKCDEVYYLCRQRYPKVVKVEEHGSNWSGFRNQFDNASEQCQDGASDTDLGDESDEAWEKNVVIGSYRWEQDTERWTLAPKQEAKLFIFGKEFFLVGDVVPEAVESLETFPGDKVVKRIKKNLEPVEFQCKFTVTQRKNNNKGGESHHNHNEDKDVGYWLDEEVVEHEEEIFLENCAFSGSEKVRVWEEWDPRTITFETKYLEKYHVTTAAVEESALKQFHTSHCYVIHWKYNLIYTVQKLDKSSSTSTNGRDRYCWFLWFGRNCSTMDRARVSTIFLNENFPNIFPNKKIDGEKMPIEEGQEFPLFHYLFQNSQFHNDTSGTYLLLNNCYYETDEFYTNCVYFDVNSKPLLSLPFKDNHIDHLYFFKLEKNHSIVLQKLPYNRKHLHGTILLAGNVNCLVLAYEKAINRVIVENLTIIEDCWVVWDLQDYFDGNFLYKLDHLRTFLKKNQVNDEEDLKIFNLFYNFDRLWKILGEDFIQEKFGMTMIEFSNLPTWQKKVKSKTLLE